MSTELDPHDELASANERQDWPRCVRIIERSWLQLAFEGDLQLLSRVVLSLPEADCRSSETVGHLSELFGAIPLGSVPVEVPTKPESIAKLARSGDVRAFVGRVSLAFIARRLHGHNRAARAIALAASAVVDQAPLGAANSAHGPIPGNSVADLKTFFYLQCGLTAHQADDPGMALRMFNQAWREREYDATGFAARGAAVRLAIEAAVAGTPEAARRWLARADEQPRSSTFAEQYASRGVDLAAFLIALDSADAREIATNSTAVTEGSERDEQWPFVSWAHTRHALMRWEPERALAMLDSLERHAPQTSRSDGLYAALVPMLRAEAELALGRGNRALAALAGTPPTRYFGRLTEARIALLTGNVHRASALSAETAALSDLTRRARIEVLLIQSVAELHMGHVPPAAAAARRAAALMTDDAPRAAVLGIPGRALQELADAIPEAAPLAELRETLRMADIYPESIALVHLTDRESAVLDLLASGVSRDELAAALFVSENTVKSQVRSLYAKLGATSRDAAITRARELGILPEPARLAVDHRSGPTSAFRSGR